ncbi:MAG: FadR/GntR family transcriptional regulator [Alphaproteobacteria bacterium]
MTEAFGPITASAAYELVAEHIRRAIQLSRFVPGDKLPPERELARQLNVSRATLREAIRMLSAEGLVEIRRGATGGVIVCAQELDNERLRELALKREDEIQNILSYRMANETAAARLAAMRRSEEDLKELYALLQRLNALTATREDLFNQDNVTRFMAADSSFHIALARASDNPYFVKAVEEIRAALFLPLGKVFVRLEATANDHHEAIYTAIERQDPEAAAAAMTAHIELSSQEMRRILYELSGKTAKRRKAG